MNGLACSLLLVSVTTGWAQQPADAQEPDSLPTLLQPVVARVARAAVVGSASGLIVELDSVEVAPALSLADMLRAMPLVRVRDNSRGETHLTLRGSESRQVSVSLDGIPLTIGWDNRADLSVIPLTGATRISAVRGLSSLLAGPNVLGGVVHVGVAPAYVPSGPLQPLRLRGGVGSGRSRAADVALQRGFRSTGGGGVLRAGGGVRRWDFLPASSSAPQFSPAIPGRRLNSDLEQWNAFVAGRLEGTGGRWLGLSSMAFGASRGVAPELHVAAPRLWRLPSTNRWVTVLGGGLGWRPDSGGAGSMSLRAAFDVGRFEIEEFDSPEYQVVADREIGEDRTITLKLDAAQSLGWGELGASLTGAETRHDETLLPGEETRYRQRLLSAAAELAVPLSGSSDAEGVGLLLGASLDGSDTPETGGSTARDEIWDWGGKAAVTIAVPPVGGRAHAGISRRTRAPSLRELYSGGLGRFVVNPDLSPETLVAAEVGLTGGGWERQWQVVGFHHRLTDGIVRTSADGGQFQRVNRDRVTATGLELVGSALWAGVLLQMDVTVQSVGLDDPAAPADEREPEYQPGLAGNLEVGLPLPASLIGRLRVSYVGAQYCVDPDLASDVRLEDAAWVGVSLERSWQLGFGSGAGTLRVAGGVHNVWDASVYDQCGLPSPGRQFILSVSLG